MTKSNLRQLFKMNLNYFLKLNDLSQADLAEKLGVSTATASDWSNGKKLPRMDKIEEIADLLGIKISDLLENKTNKQNEGYYINKKTKEVANTIANDKELRLLFDAAKDAPPEDLKAVHEMLKALKRKEQGYD
ncbi:MAG: helix-turn-helix domain-containing protein [Saccharofermentanales bacterium]|jgi:transcriptional regulator with XRE-family HTH domain